MIMDKSDKLLRLRRLILDRIKSIPTSKDLDQIMQVADAVDKELVIAWKHEGGDGLKSLQTTRAPREVIEANEGQSMSELERPEPPYDLDSSDRDDEWWQPHSERSGLKVEISNQYRVKVTAGDLVHIVIQTPYSNGFFVILYDSQIRVRDLFVEAFIKPTEMK